MYNFHYSFNNQCSHHIETSQLICRANQQTGFYMIGTLVIKGLTLNLKFHVIIQDPVHDLVCAFFLLF